MHTRLTFVWFLALGFVFGGCLGAESVGSDGGAMPDGAFTSDAEPLGPSVYVHLLASHDPVTHTSSTSGQTPRDWFSGVRSLSLLESRDDPDPLLVFDHGDGYVEASYADGADTIVGSAQIAELENTTYTWARAVHTHVRFTIDATAHTPLGSLPGVLGDLIVLSDRTTIDGTERDRGFYRFVFSGAGMEYPTEGSGFDVTPVPGGGFTTALEDGETAYYFPIDLPVRNDLAEDRHLMFEVNVQEGFRWIDEAMPGYRDGTFDFTPTTTEPIVQAGANSYVFHVE